MVQCISQKSTLHFDIKAAAALQDLAPAPVDKPPAKGPKQAPKRGAKAAGLGVAPEPAKLQKTGKLKQQRGNQALPVKLKGHTQRVKQADPYRQALHLCTSSATSSPRPKLSITSLTNTFTCSRSRRKHSDTIHYQKGPREVFLCNPVQRSLAT